MKTWYIYILGNDRPTLYIGITNIIVRSLFEYKNKLADGFTKQYNITKLLYFEVFNNPLDAITREKQLKH